MADRGRRSGGFGFFAKRTRILFVSCIAASAALSSWPLAASAAAQVEIGGDGSSLSISGGCVEIRAGDRTLSVGDCPGTGGGDASDALHGTENTILEVTVSEHISSEIEGGEDTERETTESETTTPMPHGDREVGGEGANHCPEPPPEDETMRATVAHVIDGDTFRIEAPIRVEGNKPVDRVRLIGVDSPELDGDDGAAEPYAEEAAAFTRDALAGEDVRLVVGDETTDSRGRLLAYVWARTPAEEAPHPSENLDSDATGGAGDAGRIADTGTAGSEALHFFNLALVEVGLAEVALSEPNDEYATCFEAAKERAENDGLGIHSGDLEEATEESTPPEGVVSEQYAPEEGAFESSDKPEGAEPDTEPDDAVSEQYETPEVTVQSILETTTTVPDEPLESGDEEASAPENGIVEDSPSQAPVEEEYDPEISSAPIEAAIPPSDEMAEDASGKSASAPSPETVPEEAAILSVSAPTDASDTSPLASERLAVLPDTGGSSPPRRSPGRLLFGLGLIASGMWLRLLARAGRIRSEQTPLP